jgi:hypothetical protein
MIKRISKREQYTPKGQNYGVQGNKQLELQSNDRRIKKHEGTTRGIANKGLPSANSLWSVQWYAKVSDQLKNLLLLDRLIARDTSLGVPPTLNRKV